MCYMAWSHNYSVVLFLAALFYSHKQNPRSFKWDVGTTLKVQTMTTSDLKATLGIFLSFNKYLQTKGLL